MSATADPTEALAATQAAPLFIPAESMARARARARPLEGLESRREKRRRSQIVKWRGDSPAAAPRGPAITAPTDACGVEGRCTEERRGTGSG